jgi:hypothetical protein
MPRSKADGGGIGPSRSRVAPVPATTTQQNDETPVRQSSLSASSKMDTALRMIYRHAEVTGSESAVEAICGLKHVSKECKERYEQLKHNGYFHRTFSQECVNVLGDVMKIFTDALKNEKKIDTRTINQIFNEKFTKLPRSSNTFKICKNVNVTYNTKPSHFVHHVTFEVKAAITNDSVEIDVMFDSDKDHKISIRRMIITFTIDAQKEVRIYTAFDILFNIYFLAQLESLFKHLPDTHHTINDITYFVKFTNASKLFDKSNQYRMRVRDRLEDEFKQYTQSLLGKTNITKYHSPNFTLVTLLNIVYPPKRE